MSVVWAVAATALISVGVAAYFCRKAIENWIRAKEIRIANFTVAVFSAKLAEIDAKLRELEAKLGGPTIH